jgi:hypothetical protein
MHLFGAQSASVRRQRNERVSAGHAQGLKVLEMAGGQEQQARLLCQRRDGDVGKTGVATLCDGGL